MSERIPTSVLSEASHEQIQTVAKRVLDIFHEKKGVHPSILIYTGDIGRFSGDHSKSMNREIGSTHTSITNDAHQLRKKALKLFVDKAETMTNEFDPAKKLSADTVMGAITIAGGRSIISCSKTEQTSKVSQLDDLLGTPEMQKHLTILGISEDFNRVLEFNSGFEIKWKARVETTATTEILAPLVDVRTNLNYSFRELLNTLNYCHEMGHHIIEEADYRSVRTILVDLESIQRSKKVVPEKQAQVE